MILDFTLTHKKQIIYSNSIRKFLTKQVKIEKNRASKYFLKFN